MQCLGNVLNIADVKSKFPQLVVLNRTLLETDGSSNNRFDNTLYFNRACHPKILKHLQTLIKLHEILMR